MAGQLFHEGPDIGVGVAQPGSCAGEPSQSVTATLIHCNDVTEIEDRFAALKSAANLRPALV